MTKDTIVYSTDSDYQPRCPVCDELIEACICEKSKSPSVISPGILIKREKKGRRGKTVTTVSGIGNDPRQLQKKLQQLCGAGGTYKNGIIEIQGDHRAKIREYLQKIGYTAKLAGG